MALQQSIIYETPASSGTVTATLGIVSFTSWNGFVSQYNTIPGAYQCLYCAYAAGTAGVYDITFTGSITPSENLILNLQVISNEDSSPYTGASNYYPSYQFFYQTAASGETLANIATQFAAAINKNTQSYWTATTSGAELIITSNNSLYASTGYLIGNQNYTFATGTANVPPSGTSSQVQAINPAAISGHTYNTFLIRYYTDQPHEFTSVFSNSQGKVYSTLYVFVNSTASNAGAVYTEIAAIFPTTTVTGLP